MKKVERLNFRAVADVPSGFGAFDEHQAERDGRTIVDQIKRHCDVDSAHLEWDTEVTCEFCGFAWEIVTDTADPDLGMPICCSKAQEEWRNNCAQERI